MELIVNIFLLVVAIVVTIAFVGFIYLVYRDMSKKPISQPPTKKPITQSNKSVTRTPTPEFEKSL